VKTAFRESFDSDLSAITDAGLLRRIRKTIEQVESAKRSSRVRISNASNLPASITASGWENIASDLFLKMARLLSCVSFIARKFTATFHETIIK
jgi:hypothetical protein